jgi:hypothetical protein
LKAVLVRKHDVALAQSASSHVAALSVLRAVAAADLEARGTELSAQSSAQEALFAEAAHRQQAEIDRLHDERSERQRRALVQGFEAAAKQLHAAAEAKAAFEMQLAEKERSLEALAAAHAAAAAQANEAHGNVVAALERAQLQRLQEVETASLVASSRLVCGHAEASAASAASHQAALTILAERHRADLEEQVRP